ncbi:MAG: serine hydrolase domain-containing protein [Litorimonas sp.]
MAAALFAACQAPVPTVTADGTQVPASGEIQGLDMDRLSKLETLFADRVERGESAGYVGRVLLAGKPVYDFAVGRQGLEPDAPPLSDTTRFRIASMTKPVIGVAVMTLVDDGLISLDDPVADFIPSVGEMAVMGPDGDTTPASRPITVRHLLTHMSGIGYKFDPVSPVGRLYTEANPYETAGTLEDAVETLAALPLYFQPGDRFFYSYGTDIAGRLVEVASGRSLPDYLRARIFDPLGMVDTGFHVGPEAAPSLATVYTKPPDGPLEPVPGDLFGDPLDPGTWPSGGAGLVSTVADYSRFIAMLAGDGTTEGTRILSRPAFALLVDDHFPESFAAMLGGTPFDGIGMGLGVAVVKDPSKRPTLSGSGDFGWGGHYDTQFFVSPEYDVAAVVMTQLQPHPEAADTQTLDLVKTAVLSAVMAKD